MSFNIIRLTEFIRSLKQLVKKFRSLEKDVSSLENKLAENYKLGDYIKQTDNCYKIRLKSKSQNFGKRGGFRVIYHVNLDFNHIYMILIYSKSEFEDVNEGFLDQVVRCIDCENYNEKIKGLSCSEDSEQDKNEINAE